MKILTVGHSKDKRVIARLFGPVVELDRGHTIPQAINEIKSGRYSGVFLANLRLDPAGYQLPETFRARRDPYKFGLYLADFAINDGALPTLVGVTHRDEVLAVGEFKIPYMPRTDDPEAFEKMIKTRWAEVLGVRI